MPLIVSALIRRGDTICLVEQQGPDDAVPTWMLPGGRVEDGEGLLSALSREVAEETGLALTRTPRLVFVVEVSLPATIYNAMTFECEVDGRLSPADPDGDVRRAEWLQAEEAVRRLHLVEWYDALPLQRYLAGQESAGATYRFARTSN